MGRYGGKRVRGGDGSDSGDDGGGVVSEADTDADEDYEVGGVAARGGADDAGDDGDEAGADGEAGVGAATDWRERARRARDGQRKREAKRRRDAGLPVTRESAVT